jgi:hypothetical protein
MSINRRKQVRCTLCTPFRWRGNSAERFPFRDRKTGGIIGEEDTPHHGISKYKKETPKKVISYTACPFCGEELQEIPVPKCHFHKHEDICRKCGAYEVTECPACKHKTWYREGIFKHKMWGCGFSGRKKVFT